MSPVKKPAKKKVVKKTVTKKSGVTKKAVNKSGAKKTKYCIEGKFIHVRVGNNERPASNEDINALAATLEETIKGKGINCILFVSHHAVDIEVI